MNITAKFASVCPCCSQRIQPGSKVEWTKGSKARHVACAAKPGAAAAPSATKPQSTSSIDRVYKRRYGWDGRVGSQSYYASGRYDEE